MPIYIDRHNAPEGANDKALEEAHQKDLEVQGKYQVNFLTYWFDSQRSTAFCLVEAPNKEAVENVHREAHGVMPSDIIEVDLTSVEAFLGRITDPKPEKSATGEEYIPIDSAFRCILFTDLKDSTRLSMTIGDTAAIALLEQHDQIIRKALETHSGREVKHTGDGIMASFNDVGSAVNCVVEIQEAFKAFNSTKPKVPLHVRLGINAGEPVERNNDLFGMTVQLAARICNHARPEQALVSGVIYELCKTQNLKVKFADAGKAHFKGFNYAVQLYEVNHQPAALNT